MSDDYKTLVAENARLKATVAGLETALLSAASQLATAQRENVDLSHRLAKAKKPSRVLDPDAASPFDRPYDGR